MQFLLHLGHIQIHAWAFLAACPCYTVQDYHLVHLHLTLCREGGFQFAKMNNRCKKLFSQLTTHIVNSLINKYLIEVYLTGTGISRQNRGTTYRDYRKVLFIYLLLLASLLYMERTDRRNEAI